MTKKDNTFRSISATQLDKELAPPNGLIYQRQIIDGRSPTIVDFTKATHDHSADSEGGLLGAAAVPALDLSVQSVYNPYKFYAYRGTTSHTITTATWTKIHLNTEKFDTNNNFDSTTNYVYTIPVDGFYLFTANMFAQNADGTYSILQITKNPTGANASGNGGTVLCEQRVAYTGNANKPNNASVFDQFTAGDKIGTCAYIEDGTTPTIMLGAGQTFLSGYLVSTT